MNENIRGGRRRALAGQSSSTSRQRRWVLALGIASLAMACAENLDGPKPVLAPADVDRPVEPAFVCGEQLTTEVSLHGQNFAPLVVGLPDNPRTVLPSVSLIRSASLDGTPIDGPEVLFSGVNADSQALTWQSDSLMTLVIDPELALGAGLYDVVAVNPQFAQVEQLSPLAVIDAPALERTTPGITCVAQGPRQVVASGASFISIGDLLPTIAVADADLPIDGLDDCVDIAHPSVPGRLCTTANLTIPQDAVPPGHLAVVVHNPRTAHCQSEEAVNLRVVPPPALERIEPPLACAVEGPREVTLHGQDFLTVDAMTPHVSMTLADGTLVDLEVLGVDGCSELETTGHAVQQCTQVRVRIPQQAIGAPYKPTIELTNPSPAGCLSASSVALTLVPPPTVDTATPPLACTGQSDREIVLTGRDLLSVDGTVPAVSVDDLPVDVLSITDCTDLEVDGLPTQRCTTLTVRVPEAHPMVAAGGFAQPVIRVENPQPAGCSTQVEGPLTITPPPVAETVAPPVVCIEQGGREVVISGSGMLRVADQTPQITLDGAALDVTLSACAAVPVAGLATESCAEATVFIAQDAAAAGHQALTITNPDPAGCNSEQDLRLRIVPAPRIDAAVPLVACTAEGPRSIVLQGQDFLTVDGVLPSATMTDAAGMAVDVVVEGVDGCEALDANQAALQRCTAVTISVPASVLVDPYQPTITLTNPAPAGCENSASTALLLTPPPTLAAVSPQFLCRNSPAVVVNLSGDFLTIGGAVPAVRLGNNAALAVVAAECQPVAFDGVAVERCARLEATFAPADFGASEDIVVTNPEPSGCSASIEQRVVVVDPPVVRTAEPGLLCTQDGARQIVVEGENFLRFGGQLPLVRIGDSVGPADAVEGCVPMAEGALMWERCTRVTATLPAGDLPAGRPLVEVIDPDPIGCVGGAEDVLTVPPTIVISGAEPEAVCVEAGDRDVRIDGQGFLRIDGQEPTVTLGGQVFAATLGGCEALVFPDHAAETCANLTLTVPQGSLPAGDTEVRVQNPAPSGCGESASGVFFIVPVPEVDSIEPAEVCEADVDTFIIIGRNFSPVSQVFLNEVAATAVRFIDPTRIEADFAGGLDPDDYDLRVTNADGCEDTVVGAVSVHPTPAVFFVDPPIAYNGINLQVTIYTTGLDDAPRQVVLLGPNNEEVILDDAQPTPGRPNKLLATVPAGLAVGDWTVKVESRLGCEGLLPGGLVVTDNLTVNVANIDPSYVSPTVATAVVIRSAPEGDEVGFESTPRAYLNPAGGVPDALAQALRAVVFVDDLSLTAVVPPGLEPGVYDLVIVNPDATVGLLEDAITVTLNEPPVVDGVEPASLDGNGPQVARIFGAGFDLAGVSVTMTCRDANGVEAVANAPIIAASLAADSVEATFPADQFDAGSVCVVTLTNADGAFSRFSALSIKTPAQNLNPWQLTTAMTTPRRALGLTTGRPTRTSRYLYAIGGDDGAVASAYDSVEAASINIFGEMSPWRGQRNSLPAPRTLTSATQMGGFVYLIGGNDGDGPVDSVLRAEILDPLAGPEVVDLGLVVDEDQPGLGAGLWHYRIAAVFAPDDARNPAGESLPGEVSVVQMPDVPGLQLTLIWAPVPGAVGYRVYRTAAAGDPVDSVVLVSETAETRVVDDGSLVVGEAVPLPPGSLGVWHEASQLTAPREAGAVGAAFDDAGGWLYVFGGRTLAGVTATYEFARIDLDGSIGPFVQGAVSMAVARAEAQAMRMTHADSALITAGDTWFFVGPGRTDADFAGDVDAAMIEPDGSIGAFISTDSVNGDHAGYGAGAANGFLFIFGGRGGMASDSGISAELCSDDNCRQAPDAPADLRNWNNLGVSLNEARVLMATAQESAFFFVAGGSDGDQALSSVEQTVQ